MPRMHWLVRLYDRRIVNVNVNIIVAGLMAMGITVGVMHIADVTGLLDWMKSWVGNFQISLFGRTFQIVGQKLVISGLTFCVDATADVAVYYGLHWVANHMPRRIPRVVRTAAGKELSFVRDATLIQFQRAIISPVLYLVALGTQNTLLHQGWNVAPATAIGLGAGMVVARGLHTLWMLRHPLDADDAPNPASARSSGNSSSGGSPKGSAERGGESPSSRSKHRASV